MNSDKDIERNDQLDSFSSYFREQLQDYSVEVDESLWNDLENRIASGERQRKRISPFWWWSGVASVAVVLLVLLFLRSENREETMPEIVCFGRIESSKPVYEAKAATTKQKTKVYFTNNKPKIGNKTPKPIRVATTDSILNAEIEPNSKLGENNGDDGKPVATTQLETEAPGEFLNPNSKAIEDRLLAEAESLKAKPGNWSLALHGGTTGSASLNRLGGSSQYYDGEALSDGFEIIPGKKDFMPPLAFGVSLRRDFSNKFGLETGIVYTYLRTKISQSGYPSSSLDLHYLGLSFNLSYTLLKLQEWEIYWSAGGMVEKGIGASYNTNSATRHESIQGLQWSLQTSPGISYMLKKPIGLYFEPKVAYYFDNAQPLSIRTEHPLTLGIQIGFRYNF
jgi:hypothetical protein